MLQTQCRRLEAQQYSLSLTAEQLSHSMAVSGAGAGSRQGHTGGSPGRGRLQLIRGHVSIFKAAAMSWCPLACSSGMHTPAPARARGHREQHSSGVPPSTQTTGCHKLSFSFLPSQ